MGTGVGVEGAAPRANRVGLTAFRLLVEGPAVFFLSQSGILLSMTELNLASTVCHTPNPVAADVAGETVLMSLERSRCYGLGGIGSEIWGKLESPVRVADLVEEFSGRYEAPPGVIERDVLQLLTQLADEGLIKIC
jgi:Coenzyme PQQ synthesis protein D (PqqD)